MDKRILALTAAAAIFCSPLLFADDDSDDDHSNGSPIIETSAPQKTDDTNTIGGEKQTSVQLKTEDGRVINATLPQKDVEKLKAGDKLELMMRL